MGDSKPRYESTGDKFTSNGHDPVFYPTNWRDSIIMETNINKKKNKRKILLLVDLICLTMLLKVFPFSDHTMQVLSWLFASAWAAIRLTHAAFKLAVAIAKNWQLIRQLKKNMKRDLKNE